MTTVIIGIDEQIICVLSSVERAVLVSPSRATASAVYWSAFFGALRDWVYSPDNEDTYLQEVFQAGIKLSDVKIVEGAAYDR